MRFKRGSLVKRIIAFFMAVLMVVTILPENAFVALAGTNDVITGKVYSDGGTTVIPNCKVELYLGKKDSKEFVDDTDTNADGIYTFSGVTRDKDYTVVVGGREQECYTSTDKTTSDFYSVTLPKEDQVIDWAETISIPDPLYWDEELDLTGWVTGGSDDIDPTYEIVQAETDAAVKASIDSNNKLTFKGAGNVTISAKKNGDGTHNASQPIKKKLTVEKKERTTEITITTETSEITYGEYADMEVTPLDGVLLKMAEADKEKATISGKRVTPSTSGDMTVLAYLPENDQYNEKSKSFKLKVKRAENTITVNDGGKKLTWIYGEKKKISVDANGADVSFSTESGLIKIHEDGNIEAVDCDGDAADVIISIKSAQTDKYLAAEIEEYVIQVKKADQTVSFEGGNSKTVDYNETAANRKFTVKANSSADEDENDDDKAANAVVYTVKSGTDCVIVNDDSESTGEFEYKQFGTIVIRATYPGNKHYKSAYADYTFKINPLASEKHVLEFEQEDYDFSWTWKLGMTAFRSPKRAWVTGRLRILTMMKARRTL